MTSVQVKLSKANDFCRTCTPISRNQIGERLQPDWRKVTTDWRTCLTYWSAGSTDLIGHFDRITLAGSQNCWLVISWLNCIGGRLSLGQRLYTESVLELK